MSTPTHFRGQPIIGSIPFSSFDDVLKFPTGQTVAELKAHARSIIDLNPKMKLTHTITALANAAGLEVKDLNQAYTILMARTLPNNPEKNPNSRLYAAYVYFDESDQEYCCCLTLNKVPHEPSDDLADFDHVFSFLGAHIELGKGVIANPTHEQVLEFATKELSDNLRTSSYKDPYAHQKITEALGTLVATAFNHQDMKGSAAAQVLLNLFDSGNYQVDLTDLSTLDHSQRQAFLTLIQADVVLQESPRLYFEDGDEAYQKLSEAWPALHNQVRYFWDCQDKKLEQWQCPTCHLIEERPEYPEHMRNEHQVPLCIGDGYTAHEPEKMHMKNKLAANKRKSVAQHRMNDYIGSSIRVDDQSEFIE